MAEKLLETSNALFAETLAKEKILPIDDRLAQMSNVSIAKAIAQKSIVPIAKEHAKELAKDLAKDSIDLIADALAQDSVASITDAIAQKPIDPIAKALAQESIIPIVSTLAQDSIDSIANALAEGSIDPIAKKLAAKVGLKLPGNDNVKKAGALLAFEGIKTAAEFLFPTLAGAAAFNPNGLTLALIQKKLDDISEKLDTLLEKDYLSALDFLRKAMISYECNNFKDANEGFKKVLDKSTDAYNCAKKDDLKRIKSSKMIMFCDIATKSYDEESKMFVPYESLASMKKDEIALLVRDEIEKLLKDLKNVKVRSDASKFFKTTGQKEEIDNTMKELTTCLKSGKYN